ncbi:MAG TPA: histidine kinase [Candidatus Acidoferrales bacterium]
MLKLGISQQLIFLLMLKVGLAASLAALLARSVTFRRVLYTEDRTSDQKVQLYLFLTPPLALGVMARLVGYPFADLTLEGAFVLGLLGGRVVGVLGGSIVSLPAFFALEWLATPLGAAAGLIGGLIRLAIPNKEDIWSFGPFSFLSIPRSFLRLVREPRIPWEMLPLAGCVALELGRIVIGENMRNPKWLFLIDPAGATALVLVLLSTVMAVAVPIKIWNNTRIEAKLEQNQQLLLKARVDALSSQINPHFLFNTLNAVSSLVRVDPDMARVAILKLSNILRRLLRKQENFTPLRDELDFIDDYLDIEVIRFGRDKLQIFKQIDERSLDVFVPAMVLQPIIENSIKHGLTPRLQGGEIHIRTTYDGGRVIIEVEDNGIGIPPERLRGVYAEGIGISNVHERLKVLYGPDFRFDIRSEQGRGTVIRIEIPELVSVFAAGS